MKDRKSSDGEEEILKLLPSSTKLEMTSLRRSVSENESTSRLRRLMRSVPSLGKLFNRAKRQRRTSGSSGISRSYSSSPALAVGKSEPRDKAISEMVISRKMYTSYFYRNAILFFLSAAVLVCVELRDLYNLIGRAKISSCCDGAECSLQICADTGLFLCNQIDPLTMDDHDVQFQFLKETPWFYALSFTFVAMLTVIIIMSIEAFHIQHYSYELLSYKIYVDTFGHRISKWGTISLVMMIVVVELVYVILKANLVFVFNDATHRINRCGVEYDVVVGNSFRYDDENQDDARFWILLVSNFVAPFFLFLVIWRMILGQIFEMVQVRSLSLTHTHTNIHTHTHIRLT